MATTDELWKARRYPDGTIEIHQATLRFQFPVGDRPPSKVKDGRPPRIGGLTVKLRTVKTARGLLLRPTGSGWMLLADGAKFSFETAVPRDRNHGSIIYTQDGLTV